MDYTNVIGAVVTLLTALLTTFIIPWIKQKYDSEKLKKWQAYVDIAVEAAEQLYDVNDGAAKKAYVIEYLSKKGIKFDSETVDKMIESSVIILHNELYGME